VKIKPPLAFLRGMAADVIDIGGEDVESAIVGTTDQEFLDCVLSELPNGHFFPVDPVSPPLDTEGAAHFIDKLRDKHEWAKQADEFTVHPITTHIGPAYFVSYFSQETSSILDEWRDWVSSYVPRAFENPLRSGCSKPNTSSTLVSLDDALQYNQFVEFQWDAMNAEDRVQARIAEEGIDASGWYQPYHIYDADSWGIYLHSTRLLDLGHALSQQLSAISCPAPNLAFEVVTRLILAHEFFHAQVETFSLGQEISRQDILYTHYSKSVYQPMFGTSENFEEALANFVAMESIASLVKLFMKTQGWTDQCVLTTLNYVEKLWDASPPRLS